jgi:hypothetical protein
MKKLITIISLLFLGITNITEVKAESISFDDATFINYFSNHYGYEMDSNLTEFGNSVFTWFIPEFNDLLHSSGGIISSVLFYDIFGSATVNGDGFVGEVDIFDLDPLGPYPQNLSGTYEFNLLDYGFTQEEVDSIKSITVRIMVSHNVPPSGFGPALADAVFVTSGQLPKVTFVHEGSVWFETTYVGTIDEPPTEPPTVNGFAFDTWYDENGNVLNTFKTYQGDQVFFSQAQNLISILFYSQGQLVSFQNVIRNVETQLTFPSDPVVSGFEFLWWEFEGRVLNPDEFYSFTQQSVINAQFREAPMSITAPAIGIASINPITTLLSGFGLNNQFGYIVIMLIVFTAINLFFAWLSLPVIAIAISNLILIALFIYLQFIPFWFAFIIVGLIVLAVVAISKGVVSIE